VQISALSWILSTRYGLDLHDIGLVWAAGPLAGIVGQVLIGILSDEVWLWGGRRRPFLIIGGTLAAMMLLALPSIGVISERLGMDGILGVAIAVAIALDLSINVSFNPARSLITDVTPEGAERTRGYTWMQTVSGSFGVMAYAIGAVFGNYALIYVGAAIVLLFSVLPLSLFLFKLVKLLHLYRARVGATFTQTIAAAIAGLGLSHTVGSAMLSGLVRTDRPFFRTPKRSQRHAIGQAFAAAREEALLMAGLMLSAFAASQIPGLDGDLPGFIGGPDLTVWVAVLLIQSLPYAASVVVSPRARFSATSRSSRRMILPERVFGSSGVKTMLAGFAIAPILCATWLRSSSSISTDGPSLPFRVT